SPNDRSNPHYDNGFLFKNSVSAGDNLHVLYRVEFNPVQNSAAGLPTRNWLLDRDVSYGGIPFRAGTPNPNFFHDPAFALAREPRERLFSWDSRRRIVNFALRRTQFPAPAGVDGDTFVATVAPNYTVDLKQDMATVQSASLSGQLETVPSGFGSLMASPLFG